MSSANAFNLDHSNFSTFGKELTHFHTIPTPLEKKAFENIVEKEKMLVTGIFSFAHNVFYFSQHKFQFLNHYDFVVCKCFEFGKGQNFAVW